MICASQETGPLPRRLVRSLRRGVVSDHALVGGPRPLVAYDLANWKPRPSNQRTTVTVFHDTPVPTVLVVAHPAARSRTFSSMTVMEARSSVVPSRGPRTMASDIEEVSLCVYRCLSGDADAWCSCRTLALRRSTERRSSFAARPPECPCSACGSAVRNATRSFVHSGMRWGRRSRFATRRRD